jgi:hypothetical protein
MPRFAYRKEFGRNHRGASKRSIHRRKSNIVRAARAPAEEIPAAPFARTAGSGCIPRRIAAADAVERGPHSVVEIAS